MNQKVFSDLSNHYPEELVRALFDTFSEINQNFLLGRYEPSELNGGKFTEAIIRILEFDTNNGVYTPISNHLTNIKQVLLDFEQLPRAVANDSIRISIPRVLLGIYDIRNRRGVGHLGGDVNPNFQDSSYIVSAASWVVCELFRIYYQCDLDEAQRIVDSIIEKPSLLVETIDEIKRVLNNHLALRDQTLAVLYDCHPDKASIVDLIKWLEPGDNYYFRNRVLRKLHEDRYIEISDNGDCQILMKGTRYVMNNIHNWVDNI